MHNQISLWTWIIISCVKLCYLSFPQFGRIYNNDFPSTAPDHANSLSTAATQSYQLPPPPPTPLVFTPPAYDNNNPNLTSPLSKYSDARRSLHFKLPTTFSPPPPSPSSFAGGSFSFGESKSPSSSLNNFGNMMMFQDLRWSTAEPPLYPLMEDHGGLTEMSGHQSHQQSKNLGKKLCLWQNVVWTRSTIDKTRFTNVKFLC